MRLRRGAILRVTILVVATASVWCLGIATGMMVASRKVVVREIASAVVASSLFAASVPTAIES